MILAIKILLSSLLLLGFAGLVGAWLFSVLDIEPLPDDPNEERPDDD